MHPSHTQTHPHTPFFCICRVFHNLRGHKAHSLKIFHLLAKEIYKWIPTPPFSLLSMCFFSSSTQQGGWLMISGWEGASRSGRTLESEVVYLCHLFAAVRKEHVTPTGFQANCSTVRTTSLRSNLFAPFFGLLLKVSGPTLLSFPLMNRNIAQSNDPTYDSILGVIATLKVA